MAGCGPLQFAAAVVLQILDLGVHTLSAIETQQKQVGNILWNFADCGEGETLLLVHGFPLSHQMWRFQIEGLSSCCRVLCPDLPGYGATEYQQASPETSMHQMADELVGLLDALGIERVTFCGISMGGYVGWQFWKHHAERLTRLVGCDTRAIADSEEVARGRRIIAQGVLNNGNRHIAEAMRPKLFAASTLEKQPERVAEIEAIISASSPEAIARGHLAMSVRPDMSLELADLPERPVLLVVGEDDSISTPEEMESISNRIKRATLVKVPEAGHLAPVERPEEVNQAIREFMSAR